MTKGTIAEPPKPFLVDNKRLGHRFRNLYLDGIERLVKKGQLQIVDQQELEATLDKLKLQDWVVFIEPPPRPDCQADHVLKYLARYMTGGPIANSRIESEKDGYIYFWARSEDKKKKGEQELVRRTAVEFVRSWTLHILPKGFTRSRFYGAWSNKKRTAYTDLCNQLLEPSEPPTDPTQPTHQLPAEQQDPEQKGLPCCPKCQVPMKLVDQTFRPSWRDLFYGPDHPEWMEWVHEVHREADH